MKKPKIESDVLKGVRAPHWEILKGAIWFRGTIDELENTKLRVILLDSKGFSSWTKIADRNITMK